MVKSDKQAATLPVARKRDWRKAMSDHVAYGLLAYTALQIFVTVKALSEGSSTALPYLALIVLVGRTLRRILRPRLRQPGAP